MQSYPIMNKSHPTRPVSTSCSGGEWFNCYTYLYFLSSQLPHSRPPPCLPEPSAHAAHVPRGCRDQLQHREPRGDAPERAQVHDQRVGVQPERSQEPAAAEAQPIPVPLRVELQKRQTGELADHHGGPRVIHKGSFLELEDGGGAGVAAAAREQPAEGDGSGNDHDGDEVGAPGVASEVPGRAPHAGGHHGDHSAARPHRDGAVRAPG
mmetsp:Transcript_30586/g.76045  ORF Transcript_30586/g.76045 Transcript_30586/m.76045 type:complete len:208 (-) Transcript_30586:952-1575(-)